MNKSAYLGVCKPGGDDGSTPISTTTTSGGGYYQFLNLEPSGDNDPKTNYCVVIPIELVCVRKVHSTHIAHTLVDRC